MTLGDANLRGDRICGELKESFEEPIKCPTSPSTTSGKTKPMHKIFMIKLIF